MDWIWWLVIACGFGIGEMTLTTGFWLAPFSVGAALAAGADGAGAGGPVPFIVFALTSALTLMFLRPIVYSRLISSTPTLRIGGAAVVGQRAVVLEIVNHEGVGTVKIGGEVWTARAFDESRRIPVGAHVEVVEIRGATALVME